MLPTHRSASAADALTRRIAVDRARTVAVIGVFLSLVAPMALGQACDPPVARVVSAQGQVEARRANQGQWQPVALDEPLCAGDGLRTGPASRAALALADETVTRLDQATVIHFPPPRDEKRTWLEVLEGALHVITRDRRALRVLTPFANAGIDGTEFLVTVSRAGATVLVFEGQVTLQTEGAAASARPGEQVTATAGGAAPVVSSVVRPRDAVQWTLYYPPVTAGADTGVAQASRALAVGRADEARAALDAALEREPANAQALALRSVIALVQGDREAARDFAGQAVAATPRSAAALVAHSYVQQADFDLSGALQSLREATAVEPGNAIALARLAEIRLAFGDYAMATADARRAVAADPELGLPHTVLGFAELAGVDTAAARAAFDAAIRRDSAAPLPRLGRGLALIRDGQLAAGREQIELAVILDPGNALVRSYMGKAYYEEKRDALAGTQLDIGKSLDPLDPTAFFYDAIRKQSVNRPVEALADLQRSIALNDDRAVYRSRLLLDADLAARSAAQGRLYRDLGFDELALREGWKSVATDPADYSGHRLLADSYSVLPRHEIARVNELLQSQLLQPLNVTPIQPQLGDANLFILDSAGPTSVAFNEFNPLFNRNRLAAQGSLVLGGNDTHGIDGVVAGVQDRWSFSLGGFSYETDGFRENNDLDQKVGNLFVQYQPSAATSLLAEARLTDREQGDLMLRFDPDDYFGLRQDEDSDALRLGIRHDFTGRLSVLGLATYESGSLITTSTSSTFKSDYESDNYAGEVQILYRADFGNLVAGARHYWSTIDSDTRFLVPVPFPPFALPVEISETFKPRDTSLYTYGDFPLPGHLTLTAGASYDDIHGNSFDRSEINPKLGLIWEPREGTVVRAAAFQTVQRPTPTRQNIQPSLEPTPVAGFNQFFFGSEAERGRRYGLGVDQRLSEQGFLGAELSKRDLDIPFTTQSPPPDFELITTTAEVEEKEARAYAYWTPSARLALGGEYEYTKVDNDPAFTPYGYITLETQRVPLSLTYYHPNGLGAGFVVSYVNQRGNFQSGPFTPSSRDGDDFWVADAAVQYRLPQRLGIVRLEARNLFDSRFRFQDIDPESPRILPERLVLLKLTLAY